MTEIRLGTSGWSYDEWNYTFYPRKDTKKLAYYSYFFETVEINTTFYSYPKPKTVNEWIKKTPENFKFAAKIPKIITHTKKLSMKKGVEDDLKVFIKIIEPIINVNKIGPLLVQLPPDFSFNSFSQLEEFLKILPKKIRFAVEFRHISWINRRTLKLLEDYNIAYTIVDEPLLPRKTLTSTDFAFIRWHGQNTKLWYDYQYSLKELKPWIKKIDKISSQVDKIYGYFNNHFKGFAVRNLLETNEMLGRLTPKQESIKKRIQEMLNGKYSVKMTDYI